MYVRLQHHIICFVVVSEVAETRITLKAFFVHLHSHHAQPTPFLLALPSGIWQSVWQSH